MASITIRNLEDALKQRLRVRAAEHGRSMEDEAREILRQAVGEASPPRDLAAAIRARVEPLGGIDLDSPEREPMREIVASSSAADETGGPGDSRDSISQRHP